MKKFSMVLIDVLLLLAIFSIASISHAELLESWEDEDAYRPVPILFLHGFASGNPDSWSNLGSYMEQYYSPYQDIGPILSDSSTYLERMNFQDPNGSIDRYDPSEFNPQGNSAGWADKVGLAIDDMLSGGNYGSYSNKVILIAHSMGGLAAREYITTRGTGNVAKLITIDTPHAGSPLANIALNIKKSRTTAWKIPNLGWTYAVGVSTLDGYLSWQRDIDIDGEAIEDMAIGSEFLRELNNRAQPNGGDFTSFAISAYIHSPWNRYFFHPFYPNSRTALGPEDSGDTTVPIDSQEGVDVYTNIGEVREVWHFNEIERIQGEHSTALSDASIENPTSGEGESSDVSPETVFEQILYWIDSEPPEVEITGIMIYDADIDDYVEAPFHDGVYWINEGDARIRGTVSKEFFPATSRLIISYRYENGGTEEEILNGRFLKADDSWSSGDPNSVVAGFDYEIRFRRGFGVYTVNVEVENPAGITSEEATATVVVRPTGRYAEVYGWYWVDESSGPDSSDSFLVEDEDNDGASSLSYSGSYWQISASSNANSLRTFCYARVDTHQGNNRTEAFAGSGFDKYYYVVSNNGPAADIGSPVSIRIESSLQGNINLDYYLNPEYEYAGSDAWPVDPPFLCRGGVVDADVMVYQDMFMGPVLAELFHSDHYVIDIRFDSRDTNLNINDTRTAEFTVPIGSFIYLWQNLGCEVDLVFGPNPPPFFQVHYGIYARAGAELNTQITVLDPDATLLEIE